MKTLTSIICPVDFSPASETALKQAAHFAALYKAELHLIHIVSFLPQTVATVYGVDVNAEDTLNKIMANAEKALKEIRSKYVPSAITGDSVVRRGVVSQLVADYAKEKNAELVLMATSGAHGVEEYLIGSNAAKIAATAPCPVLSLTHGKYLNQVRNVVVPVDISFGVKEIMIFIHHYLGIFNPNVTFLSVTSQPENSERYQKVQASLKKKVTTMQRSKFVGKVDFAIHDAFDAGFGILEYLEKHPFDLVVMNTHGRSGLGKFILGSVTSHVISNSTIPILSIRPQREETPPSLSYGGWYPGFMDY